MTTTPRVTPRVTSRVASPATAPETSPTEARNPRTTDIDLVPTGEVVRLLQAEDTRALDAVAAAAAEVAAVADAFAHAVACGRCVHYVGAGSSGRIAALDAAELRPTFGLADGVVSAHLAGGSGALRRAVEKAEDDVSAGQRLGQKFAAGDLVIGLTASGRTPFVTAALSAARAAGCRTALISCNPTSAAGAEVDWHVCLDTGPEAIAGSTRLKAGTAQKLALNSISTAAMVRNGRTYSNLMIHLQPTNSKLRARLAVLLAEASGQDTATCAEALRAAGGDAPTALVHLLTGLTVPEAADLVAGNDGRVRQALAAASSGTRPPSGAEPATG